MRWFEAAIASALLSACGAQGLTHATARSSMALADGAPAAFTHGSEVRRPTDASMDAALDTLATSLERSAPALQPEFIPRSALLADARTHGGAICCVDQARLRCTYEPGTPRDNGFLRVDPIRRTERRCDVFPHETPAPIEPPTPEIPQRLPATIRDVIRVQRPALRGCYRPHLQASPSATYRVRVALTIGPEGRVDALATDAPVATPALLVTCLVSVLSTLEFGEWPIATRATLSLGFAASDHDAPPPARLAINAVLAMPVREFVWPRPAIRW